jgi:hypothetical protein
MNGLQKWDLVALIDVWDESPAGSSSNLRVSLVEQVGFMGLWVYGFMGLWVSYVLVDFMGSHLFSKLEKVRVRAVKNL